MSCVCMLRWVQCGCGGGHGCDGGFYCCQHGGHVVLVAAMDVAVGAIVVVVVVMGMVVGAISMGVVAIAVVVWAIDVVVGAIFVIVVIMDVVVVGITGTCLKKLTLN